MQFTVASLAGGLGVGKLPLLSYEGSLFDSLEYIVSGGAAYPKHHPVVPNVYMAILICEVHLVTCCIVLLTAQQRPPFDSSISLDDRVDEQEHKYVFVPACATISGDPLLLDPLWSCLVVSSGPIDL